MIYLNHRLSAEEAYQFRMISNIVPHYQIDQFIEKLYMHGNISVDGVISNKQFMYKLLKNLKNYKNAQNHSNSKISQKENKNCRYVNQDVNLKKCNLILKLRNKNILFNQILIKLNTHSYNLYNILCYFMFLSFL